MVPSAATTLFEATVPSTSLRPLSRILVSLSKIGDEVCFEASPSEVPLRVKLVLIVGYALCYKLFKISIRHDKAAWQDLLHFIQLSGSHKPSERYCALQNADSRIMLIWCFWYQLLLGVFKTRNIETRENKDSSPESCQIRVIDNPQNGICRFIIQLFCKHGRQVYMEFNE